MKRGEEPEPDRTLDAAPEVAPKRRAPVRRRGATRSVEKLWADVAWAMKNQLPARELIPMLERLAASAPSESAERAFALRELAKLLLPKDAWSAARFARQALASGDEAEAWGVLGIALSMLGHYRAAVRAHRRALALDPGRPEHAHNLGHLLDLGLDAPQRALHYLELSHRAVPHDPEIAASYAHALLRTGQRPAALELLESVLPGGRDEALELIERWSA
jgi:tetratricopeptide (TPR) repeat protein